MYTKKANSLQEQNISDFTFFVKPITASFQTANKHQIAITLEKGMQTIGSIEQIIPIARSADKKIYTFKERKEISFRIFNDKNLQYQWTVYEIVDGGQYNQIDTVSFNLTKFWKDYFKDFHSKYSNLSSKIKQKQQVKMVELWKQVNEQNKKDGSNANIGHVAIFKAINLKLQFQINAKGALDEALQISQIQKDIKKRLSLQRSQLRSTMMVNNSSNNEEKNKRLHDKDFRSIGSPTAKTSNLLTVSFQHQPDLNKKQSNMVEIKEDASEQKNQKEQLRDSVGQLTLLRINTEQDVLPDQNPNTKFPQQHLKSQGLKQKMSKTTKTNLNTNNTNNINEQAQNINFSKDTIKKSSVKSNGKSQNKSLGIASKGVSRVQDDSNKIDGQLVQLQEEDDRNQNLKISSKIGNNIQQQSKSQENPKLNQIKTIVIYLIIGAIMLLVLYQLMGHSSKVSYKQK